MPSSPPAMAAGKPSTSPPSIAASPRTGASSPPASKKPSPSNSTRPATARLSSPPSVTTAASYIGISIIPAPEGSSAPPRFGNTTGVVSAALRPSTIVRVGVSAEHKPGDSISYSLDSGHTWKPTTAHPTPASRAGSIAVSADGATWVWTPDHEAPVVTHDLGATWKPAQGLTAGTRVIADPAGLRDLSTRFPSRIAPCFAVTDAAATFTAAHFTLQNAPPASTASRGDPRGGQDRLYATPGRTGDLWFAAFDGLYHAPSLTVANPTATNLLCASAGRHRNPRLRLRQGRARPRLLRALPRRNHSWPAWHLPLHRRSPHLGPHQRRPAPVGTDSANRRRPAHLSDASTSAPTAAVYSMANLPRAVPAVLRGRTHESGTFHSCRSAHSPRTARHHTTSSP